MGVKVKLPNHLQAKAMKTAVIEIEGRTVNECLAELTRRYPNLKGDIIDGRGNMLITWMVSINGEISTGPSELSHPVNDGDLLELLPMIAGG